MVLKGTFSGLGISILNVIGICVYFGVDDQATFCQIVDFDILKIVKFTP